MRLCLQDELSDDQRRKALNKAARSTSHKSVYRLTATWIRQQIEGTYFLDLTHVACELIDLGVREDKLTHEEAVALAQNHVPVGSVLRRETDWAAFRTRRSSLGPPDCHCYNSGVYLDWFRSICELPNVLFSRFWDKCHLIADYYTAIGLSRKSTLALMGMEPEDVWKHPRRHQAPFEEANAQLHDAPAAREYEWDLLGDPAFVQVMLLALSSARSIGLSKWTASIPDSVTVRIIRHLDDGTPGPVVQPPTLLHDLLRHHMPLWALQSISTEKGASAPVFGLPEDCLYITAFQPAVWTYDWGIMVRIPRFYAWQSLRARATLDFAPMMKAMQKNQPRLARSLTNMYAYAVRIRNELIKAGWRDRRAMDRAEALSRLNHRKMWERVGYSGRGGEGHRQVRRSRTAQAKHKKAKGTRAR